MGTHPPILPAADPPVNIPPCVFYADPTLDQQTSFELGRWWGLRGNFDAPGEAFGGPDPCMVAVPADGTGRPGATLAGMKPRPESAQTSKNARIVIGPWFPTRGDWTIMWETTSDVAWNTLPNTQVWGFNGAVVMRREFYAGVFSRIAFDFNLPDRLFPQLSWTYGTALPAPGANVPIRECVTYNRSTGQIKYWVERPSTGAWVLVTTHTLAAQYRDLWYGVESISPGNSLTIGAGNAPGVTCRAFVIYDRLWEPGSSLTYDDENRLTLTSTPAGAWEPFRKWQVQGNSPPYYRYDNSIPGATWATGQGHSNLRPERVVDIAQPISGPAPLYGINKATRTKMSLTADPANDITTPGWSGGKTIPLRAGGTRTGYAVFYDNRPVLHTADIILAAYGDKARCYYQHNSNSEITGGGASPWRPTAQGGIGKLPTTAVQHCSHPNTHPQAVANGALIHADICVDMIHAIRERGLPVEWLMVGTEIDTTSQFSGTNRDVDHWGILNAIIDAVRNYCNVEMGDPNAIPIITVGFGSWGASTATAETTVRYLHDRYVELGEDHPHYDVHYNQGPAGWRYVRSRLEKARAEKGFAPNTAKVSSTEDYSARALSWRLGNSPYQGIQPDGSRDIRTCAEPIHVGAATLFLLHLFTADADWIDFFSVGGGTQLNKGTDIAVANASSLSDADRWGTRDTDEESARYGVERMLAMTGGTRYAVTRLGLSTIYGHGGIRADGRRWMMGASARMAPWQVSGQNLVKVDFGVAAASRAFTIYRVNRLKANWARYDYGLTFDPAVHRIQPEPATSDASGVVTLTIEPTEVFLVLENTPLAAGSVSVGGVTTTQVAMVEATAPSGGAGGPFTFRWYRSTTPGVLGSQVGPDEAASGIVDTGLTPGTTYYYTRRDSDGVSIVYTAQVAATTSAAPPPANARRGFFGSRFMRGSRRQGG